MTMTTTEQRDKKIERLGKALDAAKARRDKATAKAKEADAAVLRITAEIDWMRKAPVSAPPADVNADVAMTSAEAEAAREPWDAPDDAAGLRAS
jgi:hypothetical protein